MHKQWLFGNGRKAKFTLMVPAKSCILQQAPPQNFMPHQRRANVHRGACVEPTSMVRFIPMHWMTLAGVIWCWNAAVDSFVISVLALFDGFLFHSSYIHIYKISLSLYINIPCVTFKISSRFTFIFIHDPHNPPFDCHCYVDENWLYMPIPFSDMHALNHGHEKCRQKNHGHA